MNKKIGIVNERVIQLLGISIEKNTEIFLGNDNIVHMQKRHLSDYAKYGSEIADIIASPDYVGYHEKDDSIEYVKEYPVNNEFVKVAVRPTRNGNYFARSLYILNNSRVRNFIKKGTLVKY